jgi:hypothetical protein
MRRNRNECNSPCTWDKGECIYTRYDLDNNPLMQKPCGLSKRFYQKLQPQLQPAVQPAVQPVPVVQPVDNRIEQIVERLERVRMQQPAVNLGVQPQQCPPSTIYIQPAFTNAPAFTNSPTITPTFTNAPTFTSSPTISPRISPRIAPTISPKIKSAPKEVKEVQQVIKQVEREAAFGQPLKPSEENIKVDVDMSNKLGKLADDLKDLMDRKFDEFKSKSQAPGVTPAQVRQILDSVSEKTNNDLKSQLIDIKEEIERMMKQQNTKIDNATSDIKTYKSVAQSILQEVEENIEITKELRKQNKQQTEEAAKIRQQVESLTSQLPKKIQDIVSSSVDDALSDKISQLSEFINAQNKQLQDLDQTIETKLADLTRVQAEINRETNQELKKMREKQADVTARDINNLQTQIEQIAANLQDLTEQLKREKSVAAKAATQVQSPDQVQQQIASQFADINTAYKQQMKTEIELVLSQWMNKVQADLNTQKGQLSQLILNQDKIAIDYKDNNMLIQNQMKDMKQNLDVSIKASTSTVNTNLSEMLLAFNDLKSLQNVSNTDALTSVVNNTGNVLLNKLLTLEDKITTTVQKIEEQTVQQGQLLLQDFSNQVDQKVNKVALDVSSVADLTRDLSQSLEEKVKLLLTDNSMKVSQSLMDQKQQLIVAVQGVQTAINDAQTSLSTKISNGLMISDVNHLALTNSLNVLKNEIPINVYSKILTDFKTLSSNLLTGQENLQKTLTLLPSTQPILALPAPLSLSPISPVRTDSTNLLTHDVDVVDVDVDMQLEEPVSENEEKAEEMQLVAVESSSPTVKKLNSVLTTNSQDVGSLLINGVLSNQKVADTNQIMTVLAPLKINMTELDELIQNKYDEDALLLIRYTLEQLSPVEIPSFINQLNIKLPVDVTLEEQLGAISQLMLNARKSMLQFQNTDRNMIRQNLNNALSVDPINTQKYLTSHVVSDLLQSSVVPQNLEQTADEIQITNSIITVAEQVEQAIDSLIQISSSTEVATAPPVVLQDLVQDLDQNQAVIEQTFDQISTVVPQVEQATIVNIQVSIDHLQNAVNNSDFRTQSVVANQRIEEELKRDRTGKRKERSETPGVRSPVRRKQRLEEPAVATESEEQQEAIELGQQSVALTEEAATQETLITEEIKASPCLVAAPACDLVDKKKEGWNSVVAIKDQESCENRSNKDWTYKWARPTPGGNCQCLRKPNEAPRVQALPSGAVSALRSSSRLQSLRSDLKSRLRERVNK